MLEQDKDGSILKQISSTLASMLTHTQIDDLLFRSDIENIGKKTKRVSYMGISDAAYKFGDNKSDKIYKSLANDYNKRKNDQGVHDFLEAVFNISRFINNKEQFEKERLEINKVLMLVGNEINAQGKLYLVKKATTLAEVESRIKKLKNEITNRKLHSEVEKYCEKEYLSEDYFHASFEVSKGVYDRLRNMIGLKTDGATLLDQVFSKNEPKIWIMEFNPNVESDNNEFFGLKDLIMSIHKMVRNPSAHKPRIYATNDLDECVEILTIISRIHRYLDRCTVIRPEV